MKFVAACLLAVLGGSTSPSFDDQKGILGSVVVDRDSGCSPIFGFVTFDDKKAMEDAIDAMNEIDLDGRAITVDKAQPQGGDCFKCGSISSPTFGSLNGLQSLHLSNNSLHGKIPSLKNCISLYILDLGENRLEGNIPAWIGVSLRSLKMLRLRSNMLNGSIPHQLSLLTDLQVLDLAENNLKSEYDESCPSTAHCKCF